VSHSNSQLPVRRQLDPLASSASQQAAHHAGAQLFKAVLRMGGMLLHLLCVYAARTQHHQAHVRLQVQAASCPHLSVISCTWRSLHSMCTADSFTLGAFTMVEGMGVSPDSSHSLTPRA
jgi:hypothetical protein